MVLKKSILATRADGNIFCRNRMGKDETIHGPSLSISYKVKLIELKRF
jgi:hypothetical protein